MARTIAQIQAEIITAKEARPELAVLNSTSAVAIWRLWTYVVAVCFWTIEKLFDAHVSEVKGLLAAQRAHKPAWYAEMARRFQYGFALLPDSDAFDNTGYTKAQIDASKVVTYAAAMERTKFLRIILAGGTGDDLEQLPAAQLTAATAYLNRVRDVGVRLMVESNPPDALKLNLTIYYDALVLDANGARIDGTADTPVLDAVNDYLKRGVGFNGLFVTAKLQDELQAVDGVVIPDITLCQASYGALPFTDINVEYTPDAGWMRIAPADLTVTYVPHEPL